MAYCYWNCIDSGGKNTTTVRGKSVTPSSSVQYVIFSQPKSPRSLSWKDGSTLDYNTTQSGVATNWNYYKESSCTNLITFPSSIKTYATGTITWGHSMLNTWYYAADGSTGKYSTDFTLKDNRNPWCITYNAGWTDNQEKWLYALWTSSTNYNYLTSPSFNTPTAAQYYSAIGTTGNTIEYWQGWSSNKDKAGVSRYTGIYPLGETHIKGYAGNYRVYPILHWNEYQVNLDHQGATTPPKRSSDQNDLNVLWEKFGVYWGHSSRFSTLYTSITLPKKTGYTFSGYYTQPNGKGSQRIDSSGKICSNTTVTNETGATVTEHTKTITVGIRQVDIIEYKTVENSETWYAYWKADTITITANSNTGTISATTGWEGSGVSATKNIVANNKIGTLPSATRPQFELLGWGTSTSSGVNVTVDTTFNTNTNIYAQWNRTQTAVKANGQSGTIPATTGWSLSSDSKSAVKVVNLGAKIGLPGNPTRSGYTFKGWYNNSSGGNKLDRNSVVPTTAGEIYNIYAQWTDKLTLTLNDTSTTFEMTIGSTDNNNLTGKTGRIPSKNKDKIFTGWYTSNNVLVYSYGDDNSIKSVNNNSYFDSSGKWIYTSNLTLYAGWRIANSWAYNGGWQPVRNIWVYNNGWKKVSNWWAYNNGFKVKKP